MLIAALVLGGLGAIIDLTLHLLQLWPRLVPSAQVVRLLTATSGALLLASCIHTPNAGAFVMGFGIMAMAAVSAMTGRDLD